MTALQMTPDEALALAEGWTAGMTFNAKSDGPFACLLVLAEEVRRLRADARRYQWLRDQELPDVMALWHQHPARVDDAIDTAMEATNAG